MGIYTRIAADAMDTLQTDAGVLLSAFNPANPYEVPKDADIIATTTGGINPTCEPQYEDYGKDVDNVPDNMMEFKHLTGWDAKMGFTSIKFNANNTAWALGAADKTTLDNGVIKIVPRRNVKLTDFKDIWWVGDKANGGAYAVRLMNAISTGGLNIKSTKNGKGTNQVELTGHVSINAQNVMPMEFYDIPPQDGAGVQPEIQLDQHSAKIAAGNTLALHGYRYPVDAEITWSSSDTDVATVSGGTVTAVAAGNCIITAAITVDGVTYNDTCTVIVEE